MMFRVPVACTFDHHGPAGRRRREQEKIVTVEAASHDEAREKAIAHCRAVFIRPGPVLAHATAGEPEPVGCCG